MNSPEPNSSSVQPVRPIVLVHGGAGRCAEALQQEAVANVKVAVEHARKRLEGGNCVDGAVGAVRHLEDTPVYNAGRGSCMNADGAYAADAAIMRSRDRAVGALGGAENLANGIAVARVIMNKSRHSLLVGAGVERFAKEHGVGVFDRARVHTEKAQRNYERVLAGKISKDGRADTVGALVRDAKGNFCAAGSTGGVLMKTPGRVGDTAMVGAGFFASAEHGACVATGVGEAIMREVFCFALLERYRNRAEGGPSLQEMAQSACDKLRAETKAAVGVLAIAPDGTYAVAHACPHMSWAVGLGLGDDASPIEHGLSR